jgi:GxxExxY protein
MFIKQNENDISKIIIDCAYKVYQILGPGLLESSYEYYLAHEMGKRDLVFSNQMPLSIDYDGQTIKTAYRRDFLVENKFILDLKAVDKLQPIHQAQMLNYVRHAGIKTGLLINFNVQYFKEGIKRISC